MNIGTIETRIGDYGIDRELERIKSKSDGGIRSEGTRIDVYQTSDNGNGIFNVVFYQSGMEKEIRALLGINPDKLNNWFGYTREAPDEYHNVDYRFVFKVRQCNDLRRTGRKEKKEYLINIFGVNNNPDDRERTLRLLKLFVDVASEGR